MRYRKRDSIAAPPGAGAGLVRALGDRAYVYGGAAAVGRPLEQRIGFLIEALEPIAEEIGL